MYKSADIAKVGEDISGGPAQRRSRRAEREGERERERKREEYTDAPGAVTSLLH